MELQVPHSMVVEHEELHAELVRGTQEPGEVGRAARRVAEVLHPHFEKEEEYALPPLGLLAALAQGQATREMAGVLALTDKLKADMPHMLAEHRDIVAALQGLAEAAKAEHKPEYERFAVKLALHAQTEEQVMYPASLLIGEYLKLKLGER